MRAGDMCPVCGANGVEAVTEHRLKCPGCDTEFMAKGLEAS